MSFLYNFRFNIQILKFANADNNYNQKLNGLESVINEETSNIKNDFVFAFKLLMNCCLTISNIITVWCV